MKLIDITKSLPSAPKYPTAPETIFTQEAFISQGAESNFTTIQTNAHAGTHADSFWHFLENGTGMDEMDLERYYGLCRVLSFPEHTILTAKDFEGKLEGIERLVMHGGGYTYLSPDAAEYLVKCKIICLVTDGWSPGPLDNEKVIHQTLFKGNVAVIENALLDHVQDGDYDLIAFPAKWGHIDGAPVRAVLVQK